MHDNLPRREFLQRLGAGVVGAAVAPAILRGQQTQPAVTIQPADVGTIKDLPKRKLGRIGLMLPPLSFGSASMGHAFFEQEPFEQVVEAAIAAGVTYMDTAPIYDVAQMRLKPILARHRKKLFLVTKTMKKSKDEALKDLATSLEAMGVDNADLCHLHNVGDFTQEQAIGKGGTLEAMLEAKKRGWIKYIGVSGHLKPDRFIPVIETGEIDMVMMALNFVGHHIYKFPEKVLPVARKHNCGIVAMKVYGGVTGSWDGYKKQRPGRLVSDADRQDAFDYTLSLPDVATCVVGMKTLDELRLAVEACRNFKPLEGERLERVLAKGARMAQEWGPHLGPVA